MAAYRMLLVLLSLSFSMANAAVTAPTVTLNCTENGFTPSVTYSNYSSNNVVQNATATIGDGDPPSNCTDNSDPVAADGSTTAFGSDLTYGTEAAPTCGGNYTEDNTKIEYTAVMNVDITETIQSAVQKITRFTYNLKCTLIKTKMIDSTNQYTVNADLVAETTTNKSETFELGLTMKLFKDDQEQNADFTVNNNQRIKVQIKETVNNNDFKFVVKRCFPSNSDTATINDSPNVNIIKDECPVPGYGAIATSLPNGNDQSQYAFDFDAIAMSSDVTQGVYIHCEVYVCRSSNNAAECTQDACVTRKRRSIEDEKKTKMVSTPQFFMVSLPDFPCPDDYVYDSIMKKCTKDRLFLVKKLYLDIEWNDQYGNVSSNAFSTFAKVTGSRLLYLINRANKDNIIKGLKIISARKGSVIVDVLIHYAETVTDREAFKVFQDVMYHTTPTMTRVASFLNVRPDKVVEYVPFVANVNMKTNIEMILVIVIVAAFILIALISGISLYRFRSRRSEAPVPTVVKNTFDNKAMDA